MGGYVKKTKITWQDKLSSYISNKTVMTGMILGIVVGGIGLTVFATAQQQVTNTNAYRERTNPYFRLFHIPTPTPTPKPYFTPTPTPRPRPTIYPYSCTNTAGHFCTSPGICRAEGTIVSGTCPASQVCCK